MWEGLQEVKSLIPARLNGHWILILNISDCTNQPETNMEKGMKTTEMSCCLWRNFREPSANDETKVCVQMELPRLLLL